MPEIIHHLHLENLLDGFRSGPIGITPETECPGSVHDLRIGAYQGHQLEYGHLPVDIPLIALIAGIRLPAEPESDNRLGFGIPFLHRYAFQARASSPVHIPALSPVAAESAVVLTIRLHGKDVGCEEEVIRHPSSPPDTPLSWPLWPRCRSPLWESRSPPEGSRVRS